MTARSFPRLENWGLELVVNYLPIVYFNSQDAADLRLIFHWLTQAGGGWADLAAGSDPYLATGSGKNSWSGETLQEKWGIHGIPMISFINRRGSGKLYDF